MELFVHGLAHMLELLVDGTAQGFELRILDGRVGAHLRGEHLAESRQAAGELFARLALGASGAHQEKSEQTGRRRRCDQGQHQQDFAHAVYINSYTESRSVRAGEARRTLRDESQALSESSARPASGPHTQSARLGGRSSSKTRRPITSPIAAEPRVASTPARMPMAANSARCAPATCAREAPCTRITAASRRRW